ncbi:carboxylate--amine ligase [Vibrio penaeicida]|uniref:carboxylate--amine ligase n=1 Tax=Vibrio penaeicida TaxID=104609 RepID=UPI000CEA268C|nr:carboxylate--amine ligase [Vibrio penaeicida]
MQNNPMRFLVTGARAPVAFEWAQALLKQGHQVYLSDCTRFPLARYTKGVSGYIKTPAPKTDFDGYRAAILEAIDRFDIQVVIPTCEEVFYLARFIDERPNVNGFMPPSDLLYTLHNKKDVFGLLEHLPSVKIPSTRLITNKKQIDIDSNSILKPIHSRFGTEVIREVNTDAVSSIEVSKQYPWVQQQKLSGASLCLYAIFEHGKLIVHQCYFPKYCLNHSAATYFEPTEDARVSQFIEAFGIKHNYHGQVSFDFMEHKGDIYVIECNPRATSGLHLIGDLLLWNKDEFTSKRSSSLNSLKVSAKHLGGVMLICDGWKSLFKKKSWRDFLSTPSTIPVSQIPIAVCGFPLGAIELIYNAKKQKLSLSAATTFDIEWNGEIK